MTITTFHTANIDNQNIFYREAGRKDAPVLLRLHGFPSSSSFNPVCAIQGAIAVGTLRFQLSALNSFI